MLSARHYDRTISTHAKPMGALCSVKGKEEVKRVVPQLQYVAMIKLSGSGAQSGRPEAVVYPMPDGELVRLRLMDNNDYDYENATFLPKNHPIYVAHQQYPDKHIDGVLSDGKEEEEHFNREKLSPTNRHPAHLEYLQNSLLINILPSTDRTRGPRISKRDKAWLKSTIEAQGERAKQELEAQSPKP